MNRSLIIARMEPGSELDVAAIFARSDATAMPRTIGVRERSLYAFHDIYVHLIDFDRDVATAMRQAQQLSAFQAISAELSPHIRAYDPVTWSSPRDAMARCFYHWTAAAPAEPSAESGSSTEPGVRSWRG